MFKPRMEVIREDAIQCWIFNENLQPENAKCISEFKSALLEFTKDYFWHKDAFNVHLPINSEEDLPPHLCSVTFYGDNIEDEWFIVYVLMELSKKFKGTVVQVRDNDGEFLLIEAADGLPDWAAPDNTDNRVYIMNGEVHLIPPELINIETDVSVQDGLSCIKNNSNLTLANSNVQSAIKKRINGYPQRITDNLHHACVRLPVHYAAVLSIEPKLIAQIVSAYCNRDTLESNICKKAEISNCTDTTVTFTKCLYAMLIHSNLLYKASWKIPPKSSNEHKRCTLGAKLACGFEILLSKDTNDVFSSKQWYSFVESLKKNGYFKDFLEGSKDYVRLLEDAKNYFLSNECSNINAHVSKHIKEIMSRPDFNIVCKNISESEERIEENSDDWLNIDPEELNTLMNDRYGRTKKFGQSDIITPKTITDELSSFLKQTSDLEGIEVEKEDDNEGIDFDYESFTGCVKNILDALGKKSDSDSDYSDMEDDSDDEDDVTKKYQEAMEEELSNTTLSQSFIKSDKCVDVTKNAYANILQSVKEERGGPGPSSNLLSTMGFSKASVKPLDSDDDEFETMS